MLHREYLRAVKTARAVFPPMPKGDGLPDFPEAL